jgi:hypothetical protein
LFRDSGVTFTDIAKYGGGYGKEPSIMKNMKSLAGEFPFLTVESLVDPYQMVKKTLRLKDWKIYAGKPSERCGGLKGTAFMVDLTGENKMSLSDADVLVGDAVRAVESCGVSFTVLYMSGDEDTQDKEGAGFLTRHLTSTEGSEADENNAVFITANLTDCALLYFDKISYGENHTVLKSSVVESSIDIGCAQNLNTSGNPNATRYIRFQVYNNETDKTDTIWFDFIPYKGSNRFWTVRIILMLDGEGMNYTLQSTSEYTYAAEGSSYHCSPETEWVEPGANTTNDTLQFKVTGLQVQIGGKTFATNKEFANAYDCVPYFSSSIWMGIISLIPIVLVLYCSLVFVFSMDTPDRFENPAGKPLQINAS